MKRFGYFVNLLFSPCFTRHLHASFSEGANYSPAPHTLQGLFLHRVKQPWHRTCLYRHMHYTLMAATLGLAATPGMVRFALLCSHL